MPLAVMIDVPSDANSAYVSTVDNSQDQRFGRIFRSEAIHSELNEIEVAGVLYPLRRSSGASYLPGIGEYLMDGFSPTFVGRGDTHEDAQMDCLLAVHASFQELMHKRPFEMTPEDRKKWSVLSSRIDVTAYRNRTPIQVRQFGRISKARPYPQQIRWESGEREEIGIEQVESPDFITFKPGQPFEAIVARDPLSFQLLKIVHIERRPEPSRLSLAEETTVLESIGSSANLSNAGWE